MGCSGSHGAVTILENGTATTNGNGEEDVKSQLSVPDTVRRVSDVPPLEGTEPPSEEIIESGSRTRPVTPHAPIPPSMAFEIPLRDEDEVDDASLVKKHPPKRFQKLEEQQRAAVQNLTLEELREKQETAELRRRQFLEARAMSAKTKFAMRNVADDQGCA